MSENRKMIIEIHADLSPFKAEVAAGIASVGGRATIPVGSPVGNTVPVGAFPGLSANGAGASEQAAIAAAQAQASATAAAYGITGAGGGMMPLGSASPNWSYLMAQQGNGLSFNVGNNPMLGTGGGGGGAGMFGGLGTRSFLGGRTALPIVALTQLGKFYSGLKATDTDVALASNDVEAFAARAANPYGESSVGTALGYLADASMFWTGQSPADLRGMAKVEGQRRRQLDTIQGDIITRRQSGRLRDAEEGGGTFEVRRTQAQSQYEKAYRAADDAAHEARGQLSAGQSFKMFGFIPTRWFDYDVKDETVRGDLSQKARNADANMGEAVRARDHALMMIDREAQESRYVTRSATTQATMVAGGATSQDVARFERQAAAGLRAWHAFQQGGMSALLDANALNVAQGAAQERGFRDEGLLTINGLGQAAQVANLQAQGLPRQAAIQAAQNAGFNQLMSAMTSGAVFTSPGIIGAITGNVNAQVGAINADSTRRFEAGQRGYAYEAYGMDRLLNNDPLGARLGSIEARREEAIQQARDADLQPAEFARRERIANRAAGMQTLLAQRDDQRNLSDIDRQLTGRTDRAQLAIRGGPLAGIGSSISRMLEQADLDVRGLQDRGPTAAGEVTKRRDVAHLELQGLENSYYRSFSYQQDDPRNVVGTGTINGVREAFRDAQDKVDKTGRGVDGAAPAGGWTPQQVNSALQYLQQMATQGIAALAG